MLISDFISEPGWERPLLRLTERHEVVAVRLVDPREYELPDAGLLFVEDAETGEQLLVDSSDPELRRRLRAAAEEQDETIRRAVAQAGVDLHVVSTEDDLVSAFVRMAESRRGRTQMTFASRGGFSASCSSRSSWPSTSGRGAGEGDGRPPSPHRASSRPAWRPAGLAPAPAVRAVPGRARGPRRRCARPMATIKTPRREATVVLAVDVSNSMAATDVKPSRFGAAKLAAERVRPPAAVGCADRGRRLRPERGDRADADLDHADVLQAINRLSLGGGTSLAAGILTSLDAIAGKTLRINQAALGKDNSGEVNIGYYGGATIVLISDGEDTSQADPVTMARLASVAGVRVQTIGVGTVAGTTVQIDGFTVATALDTQTLKDGGHGHQRLVPSGR